MRVGFAAFIHPRLSQARDKSMIPLCYYHASCPLSSTGLDGNGCDARLSKYGSALLLHLLHMIYEVLMSCTSFILKECNDPNFRILHPSRWHVTPVCSVWTAGCESAELLLMSNEFRHQHSLSTTRFRNIDSRQTWTYEISATVGEGLDPSNGIRNINYQIGPHSPVPFSCPSRLVRRDLS